MNHDPHASIGDLQVHGLARWLPVPLDDVDRERCARRMLDLLDRADASADRDAAEQLADLVLSVAEQSDPEDDVLPLLAWAHLAEIGHFSPVAVAWLRIIRTEVDDPVQVVAWLSQGSELLEPPTVDELDTPMGRATALQLRIASPGLDQPRRVQDLSAVLWLRPDPGFALLLMGHVEDLVHASAFSHALRELAEGVSGL